MCSNYCSCFGAHEYRRFPSFYWKECFDHIPLGLRGQEFQCLKGLVHLFHPSILGNQENQAGRDVLLCPATLSHLGDLPKIGRRQSSGVACKYSKINQKETTSLSQLQILKSSLHKQTIQVQYTVYFFQCIAIKTELDGIL